MILLGLDDTQKQAEVRRYRIQHGIRNVFVFSPAKFRLDILDAEYIEWSEIIQYKFFYKLLQEISKDSLIIINECLRTQNRYDLTYNCLRHFLNQTNHQLIFQYLPMVENIEDFMILFDFDTRSRWKRETFNLELLKHSSVDATFFDLKLQAIPVETDTRLRDAYEREKQKLIKGIGLKDPHTIPRNLYLMSGKARLTAVKQDQCYVGRNNRFKIEGLRTYKDLIYPHRYTVFELCHNFINFSDFLTLSRQVAVDILVADLKVDQWYFQRFSLWCERLINAYSILQRQECLRRSA